jgi:hypothetical protein
VGVSKLALDVLHEVLPDFHAVALDRGAEDLMGAHAYTQLQRLDKALS